VDHLGKDAVDHLGKDDGRLVLEKDDGRLTRLRLRAEDAVTGGDWATVLALEPDLRTDKEMWPIWAAACAIAAARLGRPDAFSYLEEAVAVGFCQPELYEPRLTHAFGDRADWPEVLAAMRRNVPPPPVTLLEWPVVTPTPPLSLDRLPKEREALLRERLPRPGHRAWDTARALLAWVADRWRHANDHAASRDAVTILDQVDAGRRFSCVEYTTVLSQALNAVGIPSRAVSLRQDSYHIGLGRGHMVSEAWIDELSAWVVLDGQNGLYWVDDDGTPLGVPQLQDRCVAGEGPPRYVCVGSRKLSPDRAPLWFSYFRHAHTTGAAWGDEYVPIFQTEHVATCDELLRDRALAYPDLAEITVGVVDDAGRPALQLRPRHPYATGVVVTEGGRTWTLAPGDAWSLPTGPAGDHAATVATMTPYATLRAHRIAYRIA
jgi:hypothetical protein